MWNHYKKKHDKKGQESIRQKLLRSNFNKEHPELSSYNFNHEAAKKELAKAIIMHLFPLLIILDLKDIHRIYIYIRPLFKVPCRNTIKNELFKIYEFERVKKLNLIESNKSKVTITTDIWTTTNRKKDI